MQRNPENVKGEMQLTCFWLHLSQQTLQTPPIMMSIQISRYLAKLMNPIRLRVLLEHQTLSGFTETETDGVRIVGKCNKEDLDLVEGALFHMLGGKVKPRESNDGKPSRVDQQSLVLLEDQDIPHAEMEMVLLAKLLDQVCSFSSWDNRQVLVCFLLQRLHVLECQNQLFPSLIILLQSNTMRVYWTGVHTSGPQKLDSDKTCGTESL
jgi:hypothetical protein